MKGRKLVFVVALVRWSWWSWRARGGVVRRFGWRRWLMRADGCDGAPVAAECQSGHACGGAPLALKCQSGTACGGRLIAASGRCRWRGRRCVRAGPPAEVDT